MSNSQLYRRERTLQAKMYAKMWQGLPTHPSPIQGDGLAQTPPLPLKAQPPPECGRHCQHGALANYTLYKGRALAALLPTSTMESAVMSFFGFL